jgi:hypothetical protein
MTELIDSPARRFFVQQVNSQALIPDLRLKGHPRERANKLSHELLHVSKSDPKVARFVALGFCMTASKRMRILLTDHADAALGQSLIKLVKQLGLEWLGFRIVGFRNGDREEDLSDWLVPLGLRPDDIVIEREQVHNPACEAALKYIAVDVVNLDIRRASREFLEVMLVAPIVELWNCVSLP